MNEGNLTGDSDSLLFRIKAGILIIQVNEKGEWSIHVPLCYTERVTVHEKSDRYWKTGF